MKAAVIGAGSWGTALSIVLAPRFETLSLWAHDSELAAQLAASRENLQFLPQFVLPGNVTPTSSIPRALEHAEIVIGVMPSRFARELYRQIGPHVRAGMSFVSATKGIEQGTLLRISQVMRQTLNTEDIAVLSGPSFAKEVAQGEPVAIVVSSESHALADRLQQTLSGPTLRLYANYDPIGVEIGAALKNVMAIAAGVCHGLGLGSNAVAALITRGLAEITRLAVAMGGQASTLAGLAGLGDLVLTCMGDLSRNRSVGIELARGRSLQEIVGSMQMIAEGVETTGAALQLARKFQVDMPITEQMALIIEGQRTPQEAIRELMDRSLKQEAV
jgi:glycerol-3-phosphate dehydrogenase (NAD(P)+)